jgi:hypothetical protein
MNEVTTGTITSPFGRRITMVVSRGGAVVAITMEPERAMEVANRLHMLAAEMTTRTGMEASDAGVDALKEPF